MKIIYGKHTARVKDSMAPIGIGGLVLGGLGMGCLLYDLVLSGAFWGWGISAAIVVCLLVSGWVATGHRTVSIHRKAKLVSVVYRGAYGFRGSHSYWAPQKKEWPLGKFNRVSTTRHFERTNNGDDVAIYSVVLEPNGGDSVTVLRSTSQPCILQETTKLAAFLELPYRQDF